MSETAECSSSGADKNLPADFFTQHGLPPNSALRHLPALPRSPSSRRVYSRDEDESTHRVGYVRRMTSVQNTPRRQHTLSGSGSIAGLDGIESLDDLSPPRPRRVPSTPATTRAKQHKDVFEGRAYPVLSTRQSLTNLARTITEAKLIAASIPLPPSPIKEVSILPDTESVALPSAPEAVPSATAVNEGATEASKPALAGNASAVHHEDENDGDLDGDSSIDSESFELDIEALRPQRTPAPGGLPSSSDLGYRQMDVAKSITSPSKPLRIGSVGDAEAAVEELLVSRDENHDGPSILLSPVKTACTNKYANGLFPPSAPRMTSRVPSAGTGPADRSALMPVSPAKSSHLLAGDRQIARDELEDGPSVFLAPPAGRTPARTPRHGTSLMPPRTLDLAETSTLLPVSPAKFAHLLADDHQIARVEFEEEPSVFLAPPAQTPRRTHTMPLPGSARMTSRLRDIDVGDRSTLLPVTPARVAHLLDDRHQIAQEEELDEGPSVFLAPPTQTPRCGTAMPPPRSARTTSKAPDFEAGDRYTLLPGTPARIAHLLDDRHQLAREESEEEPTMLLAPPVETPRRGDPMPPPGSARMTTRPRPLDAGDRSTLLPVTPARVAHLLDDHHLIAREELFEEDSMWLPPPTPRTAPASAIKPKTPRSTVGRESPRPAPPSFASRAAVPGATGSLPRPRSLAVDDTMDLGEMIAQVARPKRPSGTEESFVDLLHGDNGLSGMDESIGDESFLPAGLRPGLTGAPGLPYRVPVSLYPVKSGVDSTSSGSVDRSALPTGRRGIFAQLSSGPAPARQTAYPSVAPSSASPVKRAATAQIASTTSASAQPARLPSAGPPKRVPLSVGSRPMPASASARELALPVPAPSGRAASMHKRSESLSEAGRARLPAAATSRPALPVARSSSVRSTASTMARSSSTVSTSQAASRLPSRAPVSGLPRPGTMGPPTAGPRPTERLSSRAVGAVASSAAAARPARSFGTDLNSAMNAAPRLSRPAPSAASGKTAVPLTKRSAGPTSSTTTTTRTQRIPSGSGTVSGRALSTPAVGLSARSASDTTSASSRRPGPATAGRTGTRASDAPSSSTLSRRPMPSSALPEPRSRAGSATTLSRATAPAPPTRSLSTTHRGLPVPSRSADLLSLRDKVDRLAARQTASRLQSLYRRSSPDQARK